MERLNHRALVRFPGPRLFITVCVAVAVMVYAGLVLLGTPGTVYLKDPPVSFSVNGHSFTITYLATTNGERESGLMDKKVTDSTTMLFVFPSSGVYSFWMSGVNASLDMIWLNVTGGIGSVVYLQADAPPCNSLLSCPVYQPSANANWVIEAKGGFALANGVADGTEFVFTDAPS